MYIYLLDNSLRVEIYYDEIDQEFRDNICISIDEDCPCDEKIFINDETNIYLTIEQAKQLVEALQQAIASSKADSSQE